MHKEQQHEAILATLGWKDLKRWHFAGLEGTSPEGMVEQHPPKMGHKLIMKAIDHQDSLGVKRFFLAWLKLLVADQLGVKRGGFNENSTEHMFALINASDEMKARAFLEAMKLWKA